MNTNASCNNGCGEGAAPPKENKKTMNTVTLDTATYNEMSDYARQNNVSIAEMLKSNWHDFLEYVSTKKTAKSKDREQEFLDCFSGSDWDNDKSPSEVVDEYRRNNYSDLSKQLTW